MEAPLLVQSVLLGFVVCIFVFGYMMPAVSAKRRRRQPTVMSSPEPAKKELCSRPLVFTKVNHVTCDVRVPKPRSGHRIVCHSSDTIYSYGGFNPLIAENDPDMQDEPSWPMLKPLLRELWKYSPVTRTWHKLKTKGEQPKHLASHCVGIIGDTLIVFGGTSVPFGQASSNKIFTCDLNKLEWKLLIPTNTDMNDIPSPQYGQAMVIDEDSKCLYAVGGTTGFSYSIDVHRFDLVTRMWTVLWKKGELLTNTFPEERYRHEVVIYNNELYVFGGGTQLTNHALNVVPVFNLSTKTWRPLIPNSSRAPQPRKCHGLVKRDHFVYVIGGGGGTVESPLLFNDVWRFDLQMNVWTVLATTMPQPLQFHGCAISPNSPKLTVFGGVCTATGEPRRDQRVNSLYETLLDVPSLKELCWIHFLHEADDNDIQRLTRDELIRLGIPLKYTKRLFYQSRHSKDQVYPPIISNVQRSGPPQAS